MGIGPKLEIRIFPKNGIPAYIDELRRGTCSVYATWAAAAGGTLFMCLVIFGIGGGETFKVLTGALCGFGPFHAPLYSGSSFKCDSLIAIGRESSLREIF